MSEKQQIERTETFIFPLDILNRLDDLAEITGESKNHLALVAITHYLEDIEDIKDAEAILARIEGGSEAVHSTKELAVSLGLDN